MGVQDCKSAVSERSDELIKFIYFFARNIYRINVQHPFVISKYPFVTSKSKPRAKISFKMPFSQVNIGLAQWKLYGTFNLLPTMQIKSHIVQIVINNNIN